MVDEHSLWQALVILAAAVAAALLFGRLKVSPVLGYITAGVLIGPHASGLVRDVAATEALAHFGVVFLLFTVGLEMSVERMLRMRRHVLGLGSLQVAVTAAVLWGVARAVGLDPDTAVVLAGGLALSSTAMVMRLLAERREVATPHGRAALSVLLFQDLAVVPLLALVPLLADDGETGLLRAVGDSLLRGALALAAIVVVGRWLMRPALRVVAAGRTPEVFTGTVLLLVLGFGALTEHVGLSMALGAFLAGMLISETEFRHQFEGDIEPFRGVFLSLFFVTVGMGIDPALVVHEAPLLLGGLAVLLAAKFAVLLAMGRLIGLSTGLAAQVALLLAQGGEFAFVVFTLAGNAGVMPPEVERLALAGVALSMALTPLLARAAAALRARLAAPGPGSEDDLVAGAAELEGHVLIGGFGRVGQTVAKMLDSIGAPYLALDLKSERVAAARQAELAVWFGDASRVEVLRAAGLERAAAVVVTLDDTAAAERIVSAVRTSFPSLPVVVRAHDAHHCGDLTRAGATVVIPEIVEGSLQLGATILEILGQNPREVETTLESFREGSYERLGEMLR